MHMLVHVARGFHRHGERESERTKCIHTPTMRKQNKNRDSDRDRDRDRNRNRDRDRTRDRDTDRDSDRDRDREWEVDGGIERHAAGMHVLHLRAWHSKTFVPLTHPPDPIFIWNHTVLPLLAYLIPLRLACSCLRLVIWRHRTCPAISTPSQHQPPPPSLTVSPTLLMPSCLYTLSICILRIIRRHIFPLSTQARLATSHIILACSWPRLFRPEPREIGAQRFTTLNLKGQWKR